MRMPSAGMPPSSHRPEAPAPVPISMTALAPVAAASIWSAAPDAVADGRCAQLLAAVAGLLDVLARGDELLGVRPRGDLLGAHVRHPTVTCWGQFATPAPRSG